ncbi:carbohydrate ABC transporter permease [Robinsoniella peoriensis]|uniref:carbohydrate ABC transporter permease n=1 Tax=Robinsoniella peoriensis TaxID=180332 RepID=UPI003637A403
MKKSEIIKKIILHIILILLGLFFVFPLVWMILTALKSPADLIDPNKFFPTTPIWGNFKAALTSIPFLQYFKNSVFISAVCVVGSVFSSALTAYAFAKLKWPGKDVLFVIMLSLMMIPSQIILIPMFTMYAKIGLLNTYIPLTVPCFFGVGCSMYIFLLRQFFNGIPKELSESGLIDGAGHFRIFWSLILPLAKPGMITVSLFTFMFTWNDFFGPLIYVTDHTKLTLAVGLRAFQTQYESRYNLMMAAALVAMIPTVLIFFLAQKKFVEGITFSGIKG